MVRHSLVLSSLSSVRSSLSNLSSVSTVSNTPTTGQCLSNTIVCHVLHCHVILSSGLPRSNPVQGQGSCHPQSRQQSSSTLTGTHGSGAGTCDSGLQSGHETCATPRNGTSSTDSPEGSPQGQESSETQQPGAQHSQGLSRVSTVSNTPTSGQAMSEKGNRRTVLMAKSMSMNEKPILTGDHKALATVYGK